jgi:prepilin-type N-terminal cleavage/methylation domain-containing protein
MERLSTAGFSLIELMVSITIIGILASIIYANFGGGNAKARDAERQTDLRILQTALSQYKQQNGRYPAAGCGVGSGNWASESMCRDYIVGLTPTFITRLPTDPRRGSNPGYSYVVDSTGSVYKLMALRTVETELVTHEHPFKSCDIRVGNSGGSLLSGSTDREVIGWCGRVAPSNNLPSTCDASQAPFNNSYGIWGGFLAKTTDSCANNLPACVQATTDIICL